MFPLWYTHRKVDFHWLIDQLHPLLDATHGSEVILFHGLVMGVGVDHGGVELLVAQEFLDRSDRTASIEQLSSGGVAQAVRVDFYPHPLPSIADATLYQVFTQRLVAVEEDVVT